MRKEKKAQKVDAELRELGTAIILNELNEISCFRKSVRDLAKQFPDMAQVVYMEYPPRSGLLMFGEDWHGMQTGRIDKDKPRVTAISRIKEYATALHNLADCYKLRCDWIVNALHYLVREENDPNFKRLTLTAYAGKEIDRIVISIYPWTRYESCHYLLLKEWQRVKSAHSQLRQRHRLPDDFDLHVKWLCQRLFLGRTGKNMEERDPTNPNNDWTSDYIDDEIGRTAKLLGITLPRGRPPKSKKR